MPRYGYDSGGDIPNLGLGLASIGDAIGAWRQAGKQRELEQGRMSLLDALAAPPAGADPSQPDAGAPLRNLLQRLDTKGRAALLASDSFDKLLQGALSSKIGGAGYQHLAGSQAAQFLGVDPKDFEGGVIQVSPEGKIDTVIAPPKLTEGKGPKSLGNGWIWSDKEGLSRLPNYLEEEMALRAAGGTRVTTQVSPTAIYNATQGAAATPYYQETGKALASTQTDADKAQGQLQNIRELNRTLEGINTGSFTETKTEILKKLQALGVKVDPKSVASVEAARDLTATAVLDRMKALGGNDTTEEREWVQTATPGVLMTPEGRKMAEYITARRVKRLDKLARIDGTLADQVVSEKLLPSEARNKAREERAKVMEDEAKSWNPPTAGGKGASATPKVAPAAPKLEIQKLSNEELLKRLAE